MIQKDERLKTIIPAEIETYAYYAIAVAGENYAIVRSPVIAWALVETYAELEPPHDDGHPFDARIEESVRPVIIGELGCPDWISSDEGLLSTSVGRDDDGLHELADDLESHGQLILRQWPLAGDEVARKAARV